MKHGRPTILCLFFILQRAAKEHEHPPHVPEPKFYTHEIPVTIVPILNLAAYWYLCGGRLWRED
eukprot:1148217-Pelagomonas_calceolata.AAC.2